MNDTLKIILDSGLIAIMRADSSKGLMETARALARGGIRAMEVTLTTPGSLETISALARECRREFLIGAGTVLDAASARKAIAAGAEFLVSPNVDVAMIRAAKEAGKVVCPGALTPTEIVTAWQAGADLIKVFPASVVGPAYFKAVLAPLPQVRLVPVGGVDLSNIAAYIKAGACAVGVGGALVSRERVAAADWEGVAAVARQYLEAVAAARRPG